MEKIRVGITGYGNLGKGVEYAVESSDDMVLAGIFPAAVLNRLSQEQACLFIQWSRQLK